MRENMGKFRGKWIFDKSWIVGGLVNFINEKSVVTPHIFVQLKEEERGRDSNELYDYTGYEVDPETVGEFTGLQDKNRKEMYENQSCKHDGDDRIYKIICDYSGFRPFHPDSLLSSIKNTKTDFLPIGMPGTICEKWEIIDNPELLEK